MKNCICVILVPFHQVVILEYKSIICAGFSCVLHIHNVDEEVEIVVSVTLLNPTLKPEQHGLAAFEGVCVSVSTQL